MGYYCDRLVGAVTKHVSAVAENVLDTLSPVARSMVCDRARSHQST